MFIIILILVWFVLFFFYWGKCHKIVSNSNCFLLIYESISWLPYWTQYFIWGTGRWLYEWRISIFVQFPLYLLAQSSSWSEKIVRSASSSVPRFLFAVFMLWLFRKSLWLWFKISNHKHISRYWWTLTLWIYFELSNCFSTTRTS